MERKIALLVVCWVVGLTALAIFAEEYSAYTVQVASRQSEPEAQEIARQLEQKGLDPVFIRHEGNWYAVRATLSPTCDDAAKKRDELKSTTGYSDCIVVRAVVASDYFTTGVPVSRYRAALQRVGGRQPVNQPAELLQTGIKAAAQGSYDSAIEAFSGILAHFPGSREANPARMKLADVLITSSYQDDVYGRQIPRMQKRFDYQDAVKLCQELVSGSATDVEKQEAQLLFASAKHRLAYYDGVKTLRNAITEYRKVINEYSIDELKAKAACGIVAASIELHMNQLARQEDVLAEIASVEKVFGEHKDLQSVSEIRLLKARFLLGLGCDKEAKECLQQVLSKVARSENEGLQKIRAESWLELGQCHYKAGDITAALSCLDSVAPEVCNVHAAALWKDIVIVQAAIHKAKALERSGKLKDAIAILQSTLGQHPKSRFADYINEVLAQLMSSPQ